jgi:hypothetical protein
MHTYLSCFSLIFHILNNPIKNMYAGCKNRNSFYSIIEEFVVLRMEITMSVTYHYHHQWGGNLINSPSNGIHCNFGHRTGQLYRSHFCTMLFIQIAHSYCLGNVILNIVYIFRDPVKSNVSWTSNASYITSVPSNQWQSTNCPCCICIQRL